MQEEIEGAVEPEDASASTRSRLRFTIIHLLYLTALLAAAMAMFETYAGQWLLSVVVFWTLMFVLKQMNFLPIARVVIVILLCLLLLFLALPAVQRVKEASRRTACLNNVRQLCLAILNWESAMSTLLPAWQADGSGKPMHSWRVLLLPYIEEQALRDSYDFTEPWDGPNNRKLVSKLNSWCPYFCPLQNSADFKTPYKLVTGKGTAFNGDKRATLNQGQSKSNTILIIEDLENPVCWMEPRDLSVEEAVKLFDINLTTVPHSVVETKFYRRISYHRTIGMLDGSVRTGGFLEDPEQIIPWLMLEHPDKKEFDELEFLYPEPDFTVLYSGYFLLAFNILLAILPCFWKRLQPVQLAPLKPHTCWPQPKSKGQV